MRLLFEKKQKRNSFLLWLFFSLWGDFGVVWILVRETVEK
ncbi:hypothetical protein CCP4SC76_6580019 [Gammaproteobacteria bacterium]